MYANYDLDAHGNMTAEEFVVVLKAPTQFWKNGVKAFLMPFRDENEIQPDPIKDENQQFSNLMYMKCKV